MARKPSGGAEVKLITFYVKAGSTYTHEAEEGMTFREWVDSDYSPASCYIDGSYVYYNSSRKFSSIAPSEIIEEGKTYNTMRADSGGGN